MDRLHVGHWGTYVTTPRVDSAGAEVVVRTRVENGHPKARNGVLRSVVMDSGGREVARADTSFTLAAGAKMELEQRLRVASPAAVVGGVTDAVSAPLGRAGRQARSRPGYHDVRHSHIEYHKDRGFLLNGRQVKMRGVNLHHEAGGLGAAVPEQVWRRRLQILKAMGANAIRTAHNPPAAEFLDLCDSWASWSWRRRSTSGPSPRYRRDITSSSPSGPSETSPISSGGTGITLRSCCGARATRSASRACPAETGCSAASSIIFHREDPTRPVTTGNDKIAADSTPATLAFLNALDIVGYNYVDRWHERREIFATEDRHQHPEWKMIGTESGTIFQSFDERYSLGPDSSVVRPNYTHGMLQAERLWKWITLNDYFAGNFMWTGIDYLGESTWPFKGFPSGAMDITGAPKDIYYLYQSLWTDQPVLRLFPHWNWPAAPAR